MLVKKINKKTSHGDTETRSTQRIDNELQLRAFVPLCDAGV